MVGTGSPGMFIHFRKKISVKRFIKLILILVWILPCGLLGQKLRGTLKSKLYEGISYAVVSLKRWENGSVRAQCLSDSLGRFQLSVKDSGTYQLFVQAIGFKIYRGNALQLNGSQGEKELKPIILEEDNLNLRGVEITAKRPPLLQIKDDMIILNLGNNPLVKEMTAMEALLLAPGVHLSEGTVSLSGRTNTEIWVNGRPSKLKLDMIPADQVERIELIQNASSAYDAHTEAVINVILKRWAREGVFGQVHSNCRQGFYGGISGGGLVNMNYKNITGFLDAEGGSVKTFDDSYFSMGFPMANPPLRSTHTQNQISLDNTCSLNGGLDWMIKKGHSIGFSGEYSRTSSPNHTDRNKYTFYPGAGNHIDSLTNSMQVSNSLQEDASFRLSYTGSFDTLGKSLALLIECYSVQQSPTTQYHYSFLNPDGSLQHPNQGFLSMNPLNGSILAAKADYCYPFSQNQKLIAGCKFSMPSLNSKFNFYTATDPSESNWSLLQERGNVFHSHEQIAAGYVLWSGQWKNWNTQAGIRTENTTGAGTFNNNPLLSYSYLDFFPSASVNYAGSENHRINFSYSRKIDRPTFEYLNPYTEYSGPYSVFRGTPGLLPQYNDNLSLNYIFHETYSITGFYNHNHNKFNQFPSQNDTTKLTIFRILNFESENAGISTEIQTKVNSWLTLINTIYGFYQKETGTLYDVNFNREAWMLEASALQIISLPNGWRIKSLFKYTSPGKFEIVNTGALYTYAASIGKSFLNKHLDIAIKAEDIFKTYTETFIVKFSNQDISGYHIRDRQCIRLLVSWKFEKGRKTEIQESGSATEEEKGRLQK